MERAFPISTLAIVSLFMSYKLFNERIASAIETHGNRLNWASIEDEHFMREVFSGNYNEKNLEQLKSFIKRHNQSFEWKEEGTSFWVRIKTSTAKSARNRKKKNKNESSFLKQLITKVLTFFRGLWGSAEKKIPHKKVSSPSPDANLHNKAGEINHQRGLRDKQSSKERYSTRKKTEGNTRSSEPSNKSSNKPQTRSKQCDDRKKETENKQNQKTERSLPTNLSDFATFFPYKTYLEKCEELLPILSERIFTTSLSGDFDQFKVNLPVYITQVFCLRVRSGEVKLSSDGATFHTGIYDQHGNAVYILFRRSDSTHADNRRQTRPFEFERFVVEDSGDVYEDFLRRFPSLPVCNSPLQGREVELGQLFFDPTAKVESLNGGLFLMNNLFYLPEELLCQIPSLKGYKEELASVKGKKKIEKMQSLSKEVMKDKKIAERLINLVEQTINESLDHLRRDPRMALPAIDSRRNKIFLVLPLTFDKNREVPDAMLEIQRTGNSYRCFALSSLSKATLAIRTLASLPDGWLHSCTPLISTPQNS